MKYKRLNSFSVCDCGLISKAIWFWHLFMSSAVTKVGSILCGSRKCPYSPIEGIEKFREAMYEAKLEFPEGWGVTGQIWIFSGTTHL